MSRPARVDDIEAIALALPRAKKVTGWGGRPAYEVSRKWFVGFRSPRPDALDEFGERLTDVILIRVPDASEKLALVQGAGPFFTTSHFDGYNAVLMQVKHQHSVGRRRREWSKWRHDRQPRWREFDHSAGRVAPARG